MMVQWGGGLQFHESRPFSLIARISFLVGLAVGERDTGSCVPGQQELKAS
jgi:hypothetical protein